jgi:hypothetical protein
MVPQVGLIVCVALSIASSLSAPLRYVSTLQVSLPFITQLPSLLERRADNSPSTHPPSPPPRASPHSASPPRISSITSSGSPGGPTHPLQPSPHTSPTQHGSTPPGPHAGESPPHNPSDSTDELRSFLQSAGPPNTQHGPTPHASSADEAERQAPGHRAPSLCRRVAGVLSRFADCCTERCIGHAVTIANTPGRGRLAALSGLLLTGIYYAANRETPPQPT